MDNKAINRAVNAKIQDAAQGNTNGTKQSKPLQVKSTGQLNDLVNSAISALGANPTGILSASLSDLTSQVTSAVSSAFGDINSTIGNITSNVGSAIKGPKEVMSQIETLGSDTAKAIANPASFITRPISDVLQGTGGLSSNGITEDWLKDMGSDTLANIGKAVGVGAIQSTADLKSAISKATKDLSDGFNSTAQEIYNSLSGTVKIGTELYTSSLVTDVRNNIFDTENIPFIGGIVDSIGSVTDILPDDIKQWISSESADIIDKTVSSAETNLGIAISNTVSKVTGIGIAPDVITELMVNIIGYGNKDYNGIIDTEGGTLTPVLGNNSSTVINKLYTLAGSICSEVRPIDYVEYDPLKDLYDLLMALGAQLGITDLIQKLKECRAAGNIFFDKRTILTLINMLNDIAVQGNPYTVKAVTETVGAESIPDPVTVYKILGANLPEEQGYINEYKSLGDVLGVHPRDIIISDMSSENNTIISGMNTVAMGSTNISVVNETVNGNENRTLINSVMYFYHEK